MIKGHINGRYLVELRKKHKLSVETVSAKIGVSISTYYKWESNHQAPSILKLQMLQILYRDIDFNKLLNLRTIESYNNFLENKRCTKND